MRKLSNLADYGDESVGVERKVIFALKMNWKERVMETLAGSTNCRTINSISHDISRTCVGYAVDRLQLLVRVPDEFVILEFRHFHIIPTSVGGTVKEFCNED